MDYFDYESVAREANLPAEALATLCARARAEFPRDDLMFELHLLRMCLAVRNGWSKLEDLLVERPPSRAPTRLDSAFPGSRP